MNETERGIIVPGTVEGSDIPGTRSHVEQIIRRPKMNHASDKLQREALMYIERLFTPGSNTFARTAHYKRLPDISVEELKAAISADPNLILGLVNAIEEGALMDVISVDGDGAITLMDCSPEVQFPCQTYDESMMLATSWGGTLPTEEQLRAMHALGIFDEDSMAYILTPESEQRMIGSSEDRRKMVYMGGRRGGQFHSQYSIDGKFPYDGLRVVMSGKRTQDAK